MECSISSFSFLVKVQLIQNSLVAVNDPRRREADGKPRTLRVIFNLVADGVNAAVDRAGRAEIDDGGHAFVLRRVHAVSISASTPSPEAAQIGMTGTPSCCESLSVSMLPPLPVNSSIMLSASTVGTRSVNNWSCQIEIAL